LSTDQRAAASLPALLDVDRVVHEPARLVILTVLAAADEVEFKFLEEVIGLTKGNLSSHIAKLEAAGYVDVLKAFRGKIPVTSFRITAVGRKALRDYRAVVVSALTPAKGTTGHS